MRNLVLVLFLGLALGWSAAAWLGPGRDGRILVAEAGLELYLHLRRLESHLAAAPASQDAADWQQELVRLAGELRFGAGPYAVMERLDARHKNLWGRLYVATSSLGTAGEGTLKLPRAERADRLAALADGVADVAAAFTPQPGRGAAINRRYLDDTLRTLELLLLSEHLPEAGD